MGIKQGQQKYGCTGAFLDYRMKEIKINFDIFPPKKQTIYNLLGQLIKKEQFWEKKWMGGNTTAECEDVREKHGQTGKAGGHRAGKRNGNSS